MHAEGFAAGELKHGPIALIDEGTPVVCVVPSPVGRGVLHDKIVSNIQEVRARGARTIVIAEEGDEAVRPYADHLIEVPPTPDAARAAGHHGAAAGARLRDRDRPRPRRRPAAQPGQVGHRRVDRRLAAGAFAAVRRGPRRHAGSGHHAGAADHGGGGPAAGLAAVVGIGLGCLVWAVASALGVTAVLAASRLAFEVLRIAGVATCAGWAAGRCGWPAAAGGRPRLRPTGWRARSPGGEDGWARRRSAPGSPRTCSTPRWACSTCR